MSLAIAAPSIGTAEPTEMVEPGPEYGPKLATIPLGVGPTMDVAVSQGVVYAIGKGKLTLFKDSSAEKPELLGTLSGLGNTRQIAVDGDHAFITSREDGMFVVNVKNPSQPRLVAHYDSSELATAIAVSGNLAAVGNRFAGIELIDVSDPAKPRFLSSVLAGEVQSLVFHGKHLYVGAWSEKEVVTIDVSDPQKPVVLDHSPLGGYGDGLDVQHQVLAAATGHHASGKGRVEPGDPRFGAGHGIEFFDLKDPSKPKRVSGVKFPPFYRLGMDMWGVVLNQGYAFVNDTHNGFFCMTSMT